MQIHISGFSWKVRRFGSTILTSPNGNTQAEVSGIRPSLKAAVHLRPHCSLLSLHHSLLQSVTVLSLSLEALNFALNFNLDLKWIWHNVNAELRVAIINSNHDHIQRV